MTLPLLLLACGAPDFGAFPATKCGLHVEGVSLVEAQAVEDVIVGTFQASLDPKLHDVCRALDGWKLTVTGEPIVPSSFGGPTLDATDPSAPVSGITLPNSWEIRATSAHFILPHEAAHVAQGCTQSSGLHTDWDNHCGPRLKTCTCDNGKDNLGDPCTPGLVQPQLIDARSQLDAMFGQAP